MKDYYSFMGVLPDAPPEAIKKAFRRLAMELHPDKNHAADAEIRFKDLGEAYSVLSDPAKREAYDLRRAKKPVVVDAAGLAATIKAKEKAFSLMQAGDFDGLFAMGRYRTVPKEARELAQDWAISLGFETGNIPGLEEIAGCQEFREKARENAADRINRIWKTQGHYGKIFYSSRLPGVRGKMALIYSLKIVADLELQGNTQQLPMVAGGDFHPELKEAAGKGAVRAFFKKGDTASIGMLKADPNVTPEVRDYAAEYERCGAGLERVKTSQDTTQPLTIRILEGIAGVKLLEKAGDEDNLLRIARRVGEFWMNVPDDVRKEAADALAKIRSAPRAPRGRGTDGDFQSPRREPLAAAAKASGQKMKA